MGWLLLTALAAFICLAVYWLAYDEFRRPGGTVGGYVLGMVGMALIVFASCYSIRRRLVPRNLKQTVGKADPQREERLARLNAAVADLQVAAAKRGGKAAALLQAARGAVEEAGFRRQIDVEVLAGDDGTSVIRLVPREHPGRLENWLMAHQYLGMLIVLVVLLHASFRFRGVLSSVVMVLTLATAVSGMLGSAIYVLVPRLLLRAEGVQGGAEGTTAWPERILVVWLYVHVLLTGVLLGALLVHVVSILYY